MSRIIYAIGTILVMMGLLIIGVTVVYALFLLHWILGWIGIGIFMAIIGGAILDNS